MELFGSEVFSFKGRINRALFIKQYILLVAVFGVVYGLVDGTAAYLRLTLPPIIIVALFELDCFIQLGQACLFVRRFHDLGLSGYWCLALFLGASIFVTPGFPLGVGNYCWLLVQIIFMALKGTSGSNKYGPDPLQSKIVDKSHDVDSDICLEAEKEDLSNEANVIEKKGYGKLFGHEIFSIEGRMNRAPFIRFALWAILLLCVNAEVSVVVYAFTHAVFFTVIIRRLHDLGSSEFWSLIWFCAALIGTFSDDSGGLLGITTHIYWYLVFCLSVLKGNLGPNQYGPDPLRTEGNKENLKAETEIQYESEHWIVFAICCLVCTFLATPRQFWGY